MLQYPSRCTKMRLKASVESASLRLVSGNAVEAFGYRYGSTLAATFSLGSKGPLKQFLRLAVLVEVGAIKQKICGFRGELKGCTLESSSLQAYLVDYSFG